MNITLPDFSHIIKDEASHTYTTADGQSLRNVTAIIKTLEEPFDADYWAEVKAAERFTTKAEILAEWEQSQKTATQRGLLFHDFADQTLQGETLAATTLEMSAFRDWWKAQDTTGLRLLQSEWVIGDTALGIAGTLDALFIDANNDLILYDWKTGKKFFTHSRYYLLDPFSDLNNSELCRYSLQLSLYRLLLRRAGMPHIRAARIIHFRADGTSQQYTAYDFTDRLEAWLTNQPEVIGS